MRPNLAWCACVLLATTAHAQPVSAIDDRGVRVSLPAPPKRIVSLMPSCTEDLFALGLGGRIVGVTDYCDYPPEARRLPRVGGLTTSIEKVVSLRPDLVVASASGNRKAIEALEALADRRVPVFALEPRTLPTLFSGILALGTVTGRTAQAQALVRRLRARAALVAARVRANAVRPRVLFVLSREPLWVAGSDNFIDEMITAAGGVNVARALGPGYHTWTLEEAVVAQPDAIFTTKEGLQAFAGRTGWSSIAAVRRGAVTALGYAAVRPGPRLIDTIERMASLLHPARRR